MVPISKRVHDRGYRLISPSVLNGDVVPRDTYSTGNDIRTRLVNIDVSTIGKNNYVDLYKRDVMRKSDMYHFVATATLDIGSMNRIKVKYWDKNEGDYSVSISCGDNNVVDVLVHERDDISMGDNNIVTGIVDLADTVSIGSNNILVNFMAELPIGSTVVGFPRKWSLKVDTKISAYAGQGQTYVEVEDTTNITKGRAIYFGSTAAAYVKRIVKSVDGQKVYFDEPLMAKEATFPGAEAFNRYYEVWERYDGHLAREAKAGTRVIYLDTNANLRMREIIINGSFTARVMFVRESDNMAILNTLIDEDIPEGSSVVSYGSNPYSQLSMHITGSDGAKYFTSSTKDISIGRKCVVAGEEYSVVGFGDDYIVLSGELPADVYDIVFPAIDATYGGEIVVGRTTEKTSGASTRISLDSADRFFVGQKIRIDSVGLYANVTEVGSGYIEIDKTVFPSEINNKFYVGTYELDRDYVDAKNRVASAADGLHEYIFGGLE